MPPRVIDPYGREAIFIRLENLRRALRLNEATFCRRWGISTSQYDHYKTGKQGLTPIQAHKLCAATGVTFDFIYRGMMASLTGDLIDRLRETEEPDPGQGRKATSPRPRGKS